MAARERISVRDFKSILDAGIHIVPLREQAALFARGGPLQKAVQVTDKVLRHTSQVSDPDGTAGIFVNLWQ